MISKQHRQQLKDITKAYYCSVVDIYEQVYRQGVADAQAKKPTNRIIERNCAYCGKPFVAKNLKGIYC